MNLRADRSGMFRRSGDDGSNDGGLVLVVFDPHSTEPKSVRPDEGKKQSDDRSQHRQLAFELHELCPKLVGRGTVRIKADDRCSVRLHPTIDRRYWNADARCDLPVARLSNEVLQSVVIPTLASKGRAHIRRDRSRRLTAQVSGR